MSLSVKHPKLPPIGSTMDGQSGSNVPLVTEKVASTSYRLSNDDIKVSYNFFASLRKETFFFSAQNFLYSLRF